MRAIKVTEGRSVQLPVDVVEAAGVTTGDRLVPVVEGRSIVLVQAPDFEGTRGIAAEGGDWYGRYRERRAGR